MSIVNQPNPDRQALPNLGKSTSVAKPRRRRWRRWSIRLLLAFLVCVGFLACLFAYWHHCNTSALQAALAELDSADPGWRLADIQAARVVLPDHENSALVVGEAY